MINAAYRTGSRAVHATGLSYAPPVTWLRHRIVDVMRSRTVTVHGHPMWLTRRFYVWHKVWATYEELQSEEIVRLTRPGSVVIDLGGAVGLYTLMCARKVGPAGHVYAFEPDPSNASYLRRNVALNHYQDRVTVIEKAASAEPVKLRLYLSDENEGDNRIFGSSGRSVEVEGVRVEDAVPAGDWSRVSLIKMDIQGAEPIALDGMLRLLRAAPDAAIVTEFNPSAITGSGRDPAEFLTLLEREGFAFFDIDEQQKRLAVTSKEELLKSDRWEMNLVLRRTSA